MQLWFLPQFGCHGNSLCSLKHSDSIFVCADPEKPYHTCKNCLNILYRAEISAIWDYFCPNLVVVETALAPLKIQIVYLNSPTPKRNYSRVKFCDVLHRTEISAILAYYCPNLVAMATALLC